MVILDEKAIHAPPPPYNLQAAPPPFRRAGQHRGGLGTLPSHILLHVVYMTFPYQAGPETNRKVLYWLANSLRLVNRSFNVACMHVLRSTYLPAYDSLIRPPYTSDPFPQVPIPFTQSASVSPLDSVQRETQVLDLFITLKVREDVWMDDSELHLEREESFKDLFELNQPRARLEDLVRIYGLREGVVSVSSPGTSPTSPPRSSQPRMQPIPFSTLSVSFSTRKAALLLSSSTRAKRTIVEIPRRREEKLEVAAKKLVRELAAWLSNPYGR